MNNRTLSKEQIEVLSEYLDLLQNGFVNRFATYNDTFWFIKVKHLVNGRELTIRWNHELAGIWENGRVVKQIYPRPSMR